MHMLDALPMPFNCCRIEGTVDELTRLKRKLEDTPIDYIRHGKAF